MRIKRSIKQNNANMGFPIIGKLKVGMKSAKGYPTSLDYFVADGKYASIFEEVYGAKPSKLTIVFPSDNTSQVCTQKYELRDRQGNLYGHGDGVDFKIYNQKVDGYVDVNIDEYPNLMEQALQKSGSQKGWEMTLTLRFLLPEIRGVFGLWQFTTKGEASSIPNIINSFDYVKDMASTIVGVPFDLQVEKVKSQKPNSKSTFPVIKLVSNLGMDNLQKLKEFAETGADLKSIGLLTENKINQLTDGREQGRTRGSDTEIIEPNNGGIEHSRASDTPARPDGYKDPFGNNKDSDLNANN